MVERASKAIQGFSEAELDGKSKKSNRIESGERCNVCRKHSRKLQKLNQKLRRK